MAERTLTVVVWAKRWYNNKDYSYTITHDCNMMTEGYIKVAECPITFNELSQESGVPLEVAALQEQKKQVLANAELAAREIEDRISKLLAISYEPRPLRSDDDIPF